MGGGAIVDSLIYGTSNADGWLDDSGVEATSLAPKPSEGQSIARAADGVDSDACGEDFLRFDDPTIGSTNADGIVDTAEPDDEPVEGFEPSTCPGADAIKLNEVMVNPSGGHGRGVGRTVQRWQQHGLAGRLGDRGGNQQLQRAAHSQAECRWHPARYLLVGGALVPTTDVLADLNLGNAGSNGDAVRLLGCDDRPADTLIYGGSNDDEWVDDEGFVTSSLAPKPGEGSSLARISDGYDTDDCRDDWVASAEPTPGYANPYTEPIECQPGWKQVKINEFMANPAGSDGGAEWVELYNPHDETVTLDGWALNWGKNGTFSGSVIFPSGTDLAAGDYLLVGGEFVDGADILADIDLGNAGSNSDAIQLVDCDDYLQDTVVYGSPNDDLWLDDRGDEATSPHGRPWRRPGTRARQRRGETRIGPVMTLSSRMSRPPVPPTPRLSPWSVCRGS